MAELTVKDFESINNFSNKNVERLISEIINESSNAVFVNMFDDKVVLLDHEEGQFYFADYSFDPEELTLKLEGFEEVNIYKEENDLQEKALEYFDEDEDTSISEVIDSFKETYISQDKFIKEISQEALIGKDISEVIDWKELKGILENSNLDIKKDAFYKEYKSRIETHPLTEIKIF